jgi:succinyl-CoA synthetase beta subunit
LVYALDICKLQNKCSVDIFKSGVSLFLALSKLFIENDCSLAEINPLIISKEGLIALDGKINLDDRGLFRHKDLLEMRDIAQEHPQEYEASKHDLSYIGLDGNIGCMVNGAGLAMATMDLIKLHGGEPANFLDVGGGASKEQVANAFKLLTSNKNVQAILVNIFGGIMKCDVIAEGITAAVKEVGLNLPLVVRLEGTNVKIGKDILNKSGLNIVSAETMDDVAKKIVQLAKK